MMQDNIECCKCMQFNNEIVHSKILSPKNFRLDKTGAVSVLISFKNDPLLVVFDFSLNC